MGIGSWLGGLFDPEDQATAQADKGAIDSILASGSPYWQSGQVNDDAGVLAGAAGLKNTNLGYDSGAVDVDAKKDALLAGIYNNIYQNGGKLGEAAKKQAASDLANTSLAKLQAGSQAESANVLAVDQAERNGAASGATTARGQQLAVQLQKQLWNTAVSHANFEAALAGQGIQNSDKNLSTELNLALQQGAIGGANAESSASRQQNATDFANTMAAIQAIGGAVSNGAGTLSSMSSTAGTSGNAASDVSSGTNYSSTTPGVVLGSQANLGTGQSTTAGNYTALSLSPTATVSKYVNPITGNTLNSNLPDDGSWGDWLTGGSGLASA